MCMTLTRMFNSCGMHVCSSMQTFLHRTTHHHLLACDIFNMSCDYLQTQKGATMLVARMTLREGRVGRECPGVKVRPVCSAT